MMVVNPTNIISRIEWCRLQQQLPSVTREECESWQAEEAGLVDALFGRDRTAFMREEYQSQFTRYQRGVKDGRALLCVQEVNSRWPDTDRGSGPGPRTTPDHVDRRPSQAPLPVQAESHR